MLVHTLIKKGFDHLAYCEDAVYFREESEDLYYAAVFDGCSTGKDSHFASSLFKKLFIKALRDFSSLKTILHHMHMMLGNQKILLGLEDLELVTTFIICKIQKIEGTWYAYVMYMGDGTIYIDSESIVLESPDNKPDYLAYHLNRSFEDVYRRVHIKSFPIREKFAIATDGLSSFKSKTKREEDVTKQLIESNKFLNSEACLARRYNLLLKEDFRNDDDLGIVMFTVNENNPQ